MFCEFTLITLAPTMLLAPAPSTIPVDPKATYLHVNSDSAASTTPIDLAAHGFLPGDLVKLERLGEFDPGPAAKASISLLGVFSSTGTLLPGTNLNRVPGAIDAGVDYATACTFFGCQATDIAQDFLIAHGDGSFTSVCLTIPAGAAYLFVATHDSYYQDNSDPDGDFAVAITPLGCVADISPAGGDATIDIDDLFTVINNWGAAGGIADISPLCGDGAVNIDDLFAVINSWGPCP